MPPMTAEEVKRLFALPLVGNRKKLCTDDGDTHRWIYFGGKCRCRDCLWWLQPDGSTTRDWRMKR